MGSKYSSQAISGYNSSAPSDDSSTTEANKVKWSTIKTKLADPVKTQAAAIDSALVTALNMSARAVTTSDSAAATDHDKTIQCNTSSITITLADATTMAAGYTVSVANQSSGTINVALATSTDTIDGITNCVQRIEAKETRRYLVNSTALGYISSSASSQHFGAVGTCKNLKVRTHSTNPDSTLSITADEAVLKDSNNNSIVVYSVSVVPTITASGANGLDTGNEASGTWYYAYIIAKPDGTTAGLLSTSSSSPTMPSGYTYKALVSAVRNDGSSNFIAYRQFGNEAYFEAYQNVNSSATNTSEQTVSVSAAVPSVAQAFQLAVYLSYTASGGAIALDMKVRFISGSDYARIIVAVASGTTGGESSAMILPNVSQQFFWLANNNTNVNAATVTFDVLGFKLPVGGE